MAKKKSIATRYNYDDEFDIDEDMKVLDKEYDNIMSSPSRFRKFR
jgi:hypothetical protein